MEIESVDGILLDLGLSSIQLEEQERGFSFRGEGPLDMRMDQRAEETAADLVNSLPLRELEEILWTYGEERWARRIAKAIGEERDRSRIETTQALRKIVYRAIPKAVSVEEDRPGNANLSGPPYPGQSRTGKSEAGA